MRLKKDERHRAYAYVIHRFGGLFVRGSGTAGGNAGTGEPGTAQSEGGGANTSETAGGTTITVLNEGAVGIGVGVLNDLLEKKKQSLIKDETQNPRIAEEDFSYTPGQPLKKPAYSRITTNRSSSISSRARTLPPKRRIGAGASR